MALYLDTSVVVPYYCQEIHSIRIQNEIISLKTRPVISSLTLVEIHSALARKIRKKELMQSDAKSISELFKKHLTEGYYKKISLQKNIIYRQKFG